jgi:hypothetical protein
VGAVGGKVVVVVIEGVEISGHVDNGGSSSVGSLPDRA